MSRLGAPRTALRRARSARHAEGSVPGEPGRTAGRGDRRLRGAGAWAFSWRSGLGSCSRPGRCRQQAIAKGKNGRGSYRV